MNTQITRYITSSLCASLVGISLLPALVNAAEIDTIHFQQNLTLTNHNAQMREFDTEVYEYSLVPVTSNSILALDSDYDTAVSAGVPGGIVLDTDTLDFGTLTVGQGDTLFSDTINLDINIEEFSNPGIYRYELTNETTDDSAYLDLLVVYTNRTLSVDSFAFYDADELIDNSFIKVESFDDALTLPDNYDIIFRFVDNQGHYLADDIQFIETQSYAREETSGKNAAGPLFALTAINTNDAWNLYIETFNRLTGQNYAVVSDEIAAHGQTGTWKKSETEASIYTVTFRYVETPVTPDPVPVVNTPTPVPVVPGPVATPTVTATPTPVNTATPTPITHRDTSISQTGEEVSRMVIVAIICIVAACGFFIPMAIRLRKDTEFTSDSVEK